MSEDGAHLIHQRARGVKVGDLRQVAGGDARRERDIAAIRLQLAREDVEQGRFARAIRPDQADAVFRVHAERDAAEDQLGAVGFGEIGNNSY